MKRNIFENETIGNILYQTEKFKICPCCNHKLKKKYEGWACQNHLCVLHFKLERGWIYLDKSKKDSALFFKSKYDFDINRFENIKKWLEIKSSILYKIQYCEICKSDKELHVHHILPRSTHPELAFDKENLMVLCKECHIKIHSQDKYSFRIKVK
jgi:5-methylcytosine-specific restriction endonuclease McrA